MTEEEEEEEEGYSKDKTTDSCFWWALFARQTRLISLIFVVKENVFVWSCRSGLGWDKKMYALVLGLPHGQLLSTGK